MENLLLPLRRHRSTGFRRIEIADVPMVESMRSLEAIVVDEAGHPADHTDSIIQESWFYLIMTQLMGVDHAPRQKQGLEEEIDRIQEDSREKTGSREQEKENEKGRAEGDVP